MRKITNEELNTILENHKHWLNKDTEGWERMCADLSYADLSYTDLYDADLRYANLSNAYLYGADLSFANLSHAHLNCACMSSADLDHADLSNANLNGATLINTNLIYANISYANLDCANLSHAHLNCACMSDADLSHADLNGAILFHVNLSGANMNDAKLNGTDLAHANLLAAINVPYIPMACPDTGAFVGWKRCEDDVIVKLLIPEDARRSSATGRKCRCDKAIVMDIEGADIAHSNHDHYFVYRKGETVTVEDFDNDRFVECGPGIHFFINREEAINYVF